VISGGERLLLLAVAVGGLLAPLNFAMLAVALPDIRSEFDVSHAATAWLLSSYLITMTVAQPIAGSLGDQLGRARVLRMALLVFLICSLAATIAPSFPLLVALRVGQAASGATLIPTGMAMLRAVVPTERLGRMFGTFDAMLGIAAASGPLIGAFLVEVLSWRLLFLVNVPIVLLALWLLLLVKYRDSRPTSRLQIDWIGGTLLAGILAGFTWLFGSFDSEENQALVVAVAVGMVVLALGFVRRQTNGGVAMAPWGLFRVRSFAAAGAYVLMSNLVLYTALLTIPFFIREVQDGSPARIGLVLGALSIQLAAMAPLSGWLSDRRGRRMPAVAGAALVLAGMLMLAIGLSPDAPFAYLAIALALVGSGVGLGIGPATTAAIEIAPRALAGAVSGTDLMMSYVGSIVGTGVVAAVLGGGGAVPDTEVFRTVFVVAAVIASLTVIAGVAIHGRLADDVEAA
jgi:EmrB/QacA subfamily drug resistance transporter